MNLIEVKRVLEDNFNKGPGEGRKRNIVFWYDGEGEFREDIDALRLDNVKILKLKENNAFYIKYLLEKEDTGSHYLIYSPAPKPAPRDNWLLDILKCSVEFSADKTILIMRDLGAQDDSLRNVFHKYLKFFGNKERYGKFKSYNIESFSEEMVDTAVLAVLCKLPGVDFEQVLKKVLMGETEEENKLFEAIKSFGDLRAFWELAERRYGYNYEEKSLQKLLIMLLVSHLSYNLAEKIPESWQGYLSGKKSDCIVFVSGFMNDFAARELYDVLADRAAELLKVSDYLERWDIEKYLSCDTFREFDKKIIFKLTENLLEGIGEFDKYRKIIGGRRTSHWYGTYKNEYEALGFALELLQAEKNMGKVLKGQSAFELLDNYCKDYYLLDYYYRKFYFYYDRIENKEAFAPLAEKIENTYTNWFLNELSVKWSAAVEDELLESYPLPAVPQQKNFFREIVAPFINSDDRVFVVISDALRYEAGKELVNRLNNAIRGSAGIQFMQGVVPSTTELGMAALLPGGNLEFNANAGLLKDGISTRGTENRRKLLEKSSKDAVAISFKDILDMKRADYKETFEGKKLIYIYHNTIDAVGDKSQTERDVFEAVEKTFTELLQLVKNLVNMVSATNIIITADHGFIYRRSPLTEVDKVGKHDMEALEKGRRYMLAESDDLPQDALRLSMNYLLERESNLKAFVPKGVIRYKVPGAGANYVHGGVSLQEIVLPVIKFKNIRKDKFKASKVEVKLTNISRKITNRITFLDFFQTDLVEEKKLPLKLKLYFVDEAGNRISNENIIIADSSSSKPEDRSYREKFTLKEMAYHKNKKYYLVLEDEEESVEKIYEKIPFDIDLLISDDLGFN